MTVENRLPAVDGLRTLAVLAVFGVHAARSQVRGGYIGVDVFFVISGFVITRLLMREQADAAGRINLRRFYVNRLLRLAPPLLFMVLGVSAVLPFTHLHQGLFAAPFALSYTMDFLRIAEPDLLSVFLHTWSLAIEEQFYLAWPLLLLLVRRRRLSLVLVLAVLSELVALLLTARHGGPAAAVRIYNGPDTRAVQLLAGCLVAVVLQQGAPRALDRLAGWLAWPAALALVAWAFLVVDGTNNSWLWLTMPLLAGAAATLVLTFACHETHPLTRLLGSPILATPGRCLSYAFYLWHYPLSFLLLPRLPGPTALRVLVLLLATAGLSYLSWRFVEQPVARYRRNRGAAGRESVLR